MPVSDHGDVLPQARDATSAQPSSSSMDNDHLSPDTAIASSPLMRDHGSSPLRFLNDKARISQASSFRLSKDMGTLRWDGSELREDDLREVDEEDVETETGSVADDFNGDVEARGADQSQEGLEHMSYSTLSKRADFILAHAKRKLNLLEGNLGKARHSLTSQPTPELWPASSFSNYSSPTLVEISGPTDGTVKISPRINFGTPRHLRESNQMVRSPSGHLRMFSDTSVPSPGGATVKGSRSLEYMHNGELRKHASSPIRQGAGLNTVSENEEPASGATMQSLRTLYGASSPPPKSAHELRDQAEELRNRIAFLQKRSQEDALLSTESPNSEHNQHTFQTQVDALKRSLESQEEVIQQLEASRSSKQAVQEDPRGEWQQVLERNQAREDADGFSDDEYFDDDDEMPEELPDVLGDEDFDETKSMAAAHEDRADAFDYETFILHSAMGRGIVRSSSFETMESSGQSISDKSDGSVETEKGVAADDEGPQTASGEERDGSWDDMHLANDSMASLTTTQSFETANEDIDSDFGSDGSEQQHEDLLQTGLQNPWPMPPPSVSGGSPRMMFGESSQMPTPTMGSFSQEQSSARALRPLSSIFQTLLQPEDNSDLPRPLEKDDEALIRCCADSLRSLCLEAIHPSTSPRDMKALRERLEVAKRVLNGEL